MNNIHSHSSFKSFVQLGKELALGIITSIAAAWLLQWARHLWNFSPPASQAPATMSVVNPGGPFIILLPWALWFFWIYLALYWFPAGMARGRVKTIVRLGGTLVAILAAVMIIAETNPPRVGDSALVKGKVKQSALRYCLLVRPLASRTCWMQGAVVPVDGHFESLVHIGGTGRFMVILIANPKRLNQDCRAGLTIPFEKVSECSPYTLLTVRRDE